MESFTSTTFCQSYRSLIVCLPDLCPRIGIFYLNPIMGYFNGIIDDMISAALYYISANVIAVSTTAPLSTRLLGRVSGLRRGLPPGSRSMRLAGSDCSLLAAVPYTYAVVRLSILISIPACKNLSSHYFYFFSKIRNFALFDRLFISISSFPGRIGFLVMTFPSALRPHTHTGKSGGHVHGFSLFWKNLFTIRSSKE